MNGFRRLPQRWLRPRTVQVTEVSTQMKNESPAKHRRCVPRETSVLLVLACNCRKGIPSGCKYDWARWHVPSKGQKAENEPFDLGSQEENRNKSSSDEEKWSARWRIARPRHVSIARARTGTRRHGITATCSPLRRSRARRPGTRVLQGLGTSMTTTAWFCCEAGEAGMDYMGWKVDFPRQRWKSWPATWNNPALHRSELDSRRRTPGHRRAFPLHDPDRPRDGAVRRGHRRQQLRHRRAGRQPQTRGRTT